MFDNYSRTSVSANSPISVNAVTGNILKNYRKSFFKRFHLESKLASQLFDEDQPHLEKSITKYYGDDDYSGHKTTEKRPVVVIQMMMCGEMDVIAEIMWQEDFESMFSDSEK